MLFPGSITETGEIESPAFQYALMSGPYAYVPDKNSVRVIDTSKRKVVSSINMKGGETPGMGTLLVGAVAPSKDGKYVYVAVFQSVYDDYYMSNNHTTTIYRLNASTQEAIDYYKAVDIRPMYMAASPDGKVYLAQKKSRYPENAGVTIMDFASQKTWSIDTESGALIKDFEFADKGGIVYYSGWYDYARFYKLGWKANKISTISTYGNYSDTYQYTRSIALGKGGKMLYAAINRNSGILAMNSIDGGMQKIPTNYVPVTLASSPDGETLYAIGYFYSQEDKPIYVFHRYSNLKQIPELYNRDADYTMESKSGFYGSDAMAYIKAPSGEYPSHLEIDPDGRFGYVTTSDGDGISYGTGTSVIVYDLENLVQMLPIEGKEMGPAVSACPEKIIYSPAPDYSWAKEIAPSMQSGALDFLSGYTYAKSLYPSKGSFAEHYAEDYFVAYATFTDYLDNTTVGNATFWLTEKSGAVVPGNARAASKLAIFTPDLQLKPDMDYVAHLSKAIKSKDGKPLYADVEWEFSTRNSTGISISLPNTTLKADAAVGKVLSNAGKFTAPEGNSSANQANTSLEWHTGKSSPIIRLPDLAKNSQGGNESASQNQGENGGAQNQQGSAQGQTEAGASKGNKTDEGEIGMEGAIANESKTGPDQKEQAAGVNQANGAQSAPAGEIGFIEGIIGFIKSILGLN